MNDVLDEIDRAILTCLTQDARVSLKVLSARVGLTSPSTAERVKRLEERGVIQGYGARVNLAALGYSLQALVRVRPLPGRLFCDASRGARYCPAGYPAGRSGGVCAV